MKNIKPIFINLLLAGASLQALAYTAKFNNSDTQYLWSDSTIWDTVPSGDGIVNILSGSTAGSSILLKDTIFANRYTTDLGANVTFNLEGATYLLLPSNTGNLALTDAAMNVTKLSELVTNGANPGYPEIWLKGTSTLNIDNSKLIQGTWAKIQAENSSIFNFANGSTHGGAYSQFLFSDMSKGIFDNASYSKVIWNTSTFSESAELIVRNTGSFTNTGRHSGTGFYFKDNAKLTLESGGKFSTYAGVDPLYIQNNASVNISGLGSQLALGSQFILSESAKVIVSGGGSLTNNTNSEAISLKDDSIVEVLGTGSLINIGSRLNLTENAKINIRDGATGTFSNLNIESANSSANYYTSTMSIGNFSATGEGWINLFADSILARQSGATINLSGDAKISLKAGAEFRAGHTTGLKLNDNAQLVLDGGNYATGNFGVIEATGGTLTFKNGAKIDGKYDATNTTSRFVNYKFSGSSALNYIDANTIVTAQHYNGVGSQFSGTSQFNISNSASAIFTAFGGGENLLAFSENASLNLTNGGALTIKVNHSEGVYDGIAIKENATMNVAGNTNANSSVDAGLFKMSSTLQTDSANVKIKGYTNFTAVTTNIGVLATDIGTHTMEISGDANTVRFGALNIGNATAGKSTLIINGSANTGLYVTAQNGIKFVGSENTGFGNQIGGAIKFVADRYGISTIEASAVTEFSGLLELDFSEYTSKGSATNTFVIVTSGEDWDIFASNYVCDSETYNKLVNVIKNKDGDSWRIESNGYELSIIYSSIPEPSTYAMLVALLSLGFAIYRKRKI